MLTHELLAASHNTPAASAKLLLTVHEAASALGISRSIFYELMVAGEIQSVKIGRLRRIPYQALEVFVSQQIAHQCPALAATVVQALQEG